MKISNKLILISIILAIFIPAISSATTWYIMNKKNATGYIINSTKKPKIEKGIIIFNQNELDLYDKFQNEMFKSGYMTMTDDQMTMAIARKWNVTANKLKEINLYGMMIQGAIKNGKIKKKGIANNNQVTVPIVEKIIMKQGYKMAGVRLISQLAGKYTGKQLVKVTIPMKDNLTNNLKVMNAEIDANNIKNSLKKYSNIGEILFQFVEYTTDGQEVVTFKGVLNLKSKALYNTYIHKSLQ